MLGMQSYYIYPLVMTNIAMEAMVHWNRWFSQLETSIYKGFSMAMLNNQMVYIYIYTTVPIIGGMDGDSPKKPCCFSRGGNGDVIWYDVSPAAEACDLNDSEWWFFINNIWRYHGDILGICTNDIPIVGDVTSPRVRSHHDSQMIPMFWCTIPLFVR